MNASSAPEGAAAALLASGRWSEARHAFLELLSREPGHDTWSCGAARASFALSEPAEAERRLLEAMRIHGPETRAAGLLREWLVAERQLDRLHALLPAPAAPRPEGESQILAAVHAHLRGDFARAAALCRESLRHARHPAALNHLARAVHNLGQGETALGLFRDAVAADPLYAEAWHNLAHALRAAARLEEALPAYERALSLNPRFRQAALNLGKTLLALDRPQQALAAFDRCLAPDRDDPEASTHRALCLHLLGRGEEALAIHREVTRAHPSYGPAWLYYGSALNEAGARTEALAALNQARRLLPDDPEVWAELAILHEVDNRLDEMAIALRHGLRLDPRHPRLTIEAARHERRSGRPEAAMARLKSLPVGRLPARQQTAWWYELGRSQDDLQQCDAAFDAFANANRLASAELSLRTADREALPATARALLDWTRTTNVLPAGGRDDAPVFLLGFPRSGITLVNLMLGCHSAVATLEEKPTLEACLAELARQPGGYPAALDRLDDAERDRLRRLYRTQVARCGGEAAAGAVLVDMFPLRSLHVGAIAHLFPGARVVFVQRHPADVVLSNFMQEYAQNAANTQFLTLADAARFYGLVMDVWHAGAAKFPLRVHTLRYEDLVLDPERHLSTLTEFLGLGFERAMLEGYRERARLHRVSTSSYHQVAAPLNDRSIGRWRRYRRQLEPVLPLLAPHAARMGYALD